MSWRTLNLIFIAVMSVIIMQAYLAPDPIEAEINDLKARGMLKQTAETPKP